jgi:hypothetical protein
MYKSHGSISKTPMHQNNMSMEQILSGRSKSPSSATKIAEKNSNTETQHKRPTFAAMKQTF